MNYKTNLPLPVYREPGIPWDTAIKVFPGRPLHWALSLLSSDTTVEVYYDAVNLLFSGSVFEAECFLGQVEKFVPNAIIEKVLNEVNRVDLIIFLKYDEPEEQPKEQEPVAEPEKYPEEEGRFVLNDIISSINKYIGRTAEDVVADILSCSTPDRMYINDTTNGGGHLLKSPYNISVLQDRPTVGVDVCVNKTGKVVVTIQV